MLFKKFYPCEMQHEQSDCGVAAVATILKVYKSHLTFRNIRYYTKTDGDGTTVKGIVSALEKLHFDVKAIRTESRYFTKDMTLPAIAHVVTAEGFNHFVVIHKIYENKLLIADPAKGIMKISIKEFDQLFSGVLIMMNPKSSFESTVEKEEVSLWKLFKELIFPQKKMLSIIILSSILLSIIGIVAGFFPKIIFDEVIPYELKNSLIAYAFAFGIIAILQSLLGAFREHIILYLSRKFDIPVFLGYFNKIINLPYKYLNSRKVGDILTRFQDAMTIKEIFTTVAISLVLDVMLSVIVGGVLWNLNSTLFYIILGIVVINILLVYGFKGFYKRINYEEMAASSELNSYLIESFNNIETIKSFNNEKFRIDNIEHKLVKSLKIGFKEGVMSNIHGTSASLVGIIGNLAFMVVGALAIIDGNFTIGSLIVFQTLSQYFVAPVNNLVSLQLTFQEGQIAMRRLSELVNTDLKDEQTHFMEHVDFTKAITIKNASLAYGHRKKILDNFNLEVQHGQKIAIIGESGAGKSTIAKLLLKLEDLDAGSIEIGGISIDEIDPTHIRQHIAYIPQKIEMFSGSILDNITMGNEEVPYSKVVEVTKLIGLHQFIDNLPNRYNTEVGEFGSNLSGGEQQRIAIARAILLDPQVYIFDEATSNLDSISERKIQDYIFKYNPDKTVIMIAHRLSTITSCDTIHYLKDGKIIESGTHEELLKQQGEYSNLVFGSNLTDNLAVPSTVLSDLTSGDEVTYE